MSTKCNTCGVVYQMTYLKEKKLYWCQACSTQHIFTPHSIKDFAPFSSVEEAIAFQTEMRKQQEGVYNNHRSYWLN